MNNLFEKQICEVNYIRGLLASNKVGHFRIYVNYHEYGIKFALGALEA
jgi:hypothetical protein